MAIADDDTTPTSPQKSNGPLGILVQAALAIGRHRTYSMLWPRLSAVLEELGLTLGLLASDITRHTTNPVLVRGNHEEFETRALEALAKAVNGEPPPKETKR